MTASIQNVSLTQVVAVCDSLGILADGLMQPNTLAMVVGMTKNVIFTKLTSKVLSEIEQRHPVEKIIHNAAYLYTLETGDDSKVFLLLLKEIMNGIKNMLQDSNETEVRRTILKQISRFKTFLPDIYKNILNTYAIFSDVNFHSLPKELEGLISTFFFSKFPVNISKKLSSLVCSFLSASVSDSNQAIAALTYFISNFDAFCTKVIASSSESMIQEGFLLNKRLSPLWAHKKMIKFVVVSNLPCKSDDAIWEINGGSFLQKLGNLWEPVKDIMNHLKSMGISLILTSGGACDDFKSLCSQNGILIISGVSKEDLDSIIYLVNISPMNSLHDYVHPQNIGCFESLTPLLVGSTSFMNVKISAHKHSYIIPHHLLLCAPVEEVLKDYYAECLNCLKAVKQWLQPLNREVFYKEKLSNCLIIQNYLKNDFKQVLKNSKPNILSESIASSYNLGVAFPLGLFEFAVKNVLTSFCNDKLSIVKNVCSILDSALLIVIHKLWNTPKLVAIEEQNYIEFHKKIKCRITIPLEPASSKEHLLYRVLQLVEQLVKIDAILSSK